MLKHNTTLCDLVKILPNTVEQFIDAVGKNSAFLIGGPYVESNGVPARTPRRPVPVYRSGTRIFLLDARKQDKWAVGRHDDNDIVIGEPTVSEFHCVVELLGNMYRILDIGSTNGTRVNRRKINDYQILFDSSSLSFGLSDSVYSFHMPSSAYRLCKAFIEEF